MNELKIILPWPDSKLSPNRKNGNHWGAHQSAKEKARSAGYNLTTMALNNSGLVFDGEKIQRLETAITFFEPNRRRRDLDNLLASCKPMIDGVAKAMRVDDSKFCPVTLNRAQDENKKGFVQIIFKF